MYYKVKPDSDTHKKLDAIFQRMRECNKASIELMKEVGAEALYRSSFDKAGGVLFFQFDGPPPENWKAYKNGHMPKKCKSNEDLLNRIERLPRVSVIEWSDIFDLGLEYQPGTFKDKETNTYYVDAVFNHPVKITHEDFIEIKMSEWALAKEKL